MAAATVLGIGIAVASLNAVVDPFGTLRLVELPGFNAFKPAMQNRVRLAKAYDVRRIEPRAIVLGTSRSHVALRPSHEGWDRATSPYNLAFDGATTEEMYRYLLHAYAVAPVRQVVLGLDTWQLGHNPSAVRPDFDPSLLYEPGATAKTVAVHLADLRLLLNLTTLEASLRTLWTQEDAEPDWLAHDGQRRGEIYFHHAEEFVTRGAGSYFAEVDRREIDSKLDGAEPTHGHRSKEPVPVSTLTSFDYIRAMVAFCRAENIDLRIFITPAHAHQMEISAAMGEWPKIEQGKRELVALLAEDAARHPDRQPFPLWDFSGYSSVTTEAVSPPGSAVEMRYYWDSSHFKEIVGDFVLDRLFGIDRRDQPVPKDFGRLLTADTIDQALADARVGHDRYQREHEADIAAILATVAAARGAAGMPVPTQTAGLP
ncbi:MAG TPA: hypothetical protein VET85_13560 [Stellaceae bacterium]|nr:hypothetical protein [Stellaceae bacterium]